MRTVCNASGEAEVVEGLPTYLALYIELVSAEEPHDWWKKDQETDYNARDSPVIEGVGHVEGRWCPVSMEIVLDVQFQGGAVDKRYSYS
jgi:hypothetical protein